MIVRFKLYSTAFEDSLGRCPSMSKSVHEQVWLVVEAGTFDRVQNKTKGRAVRAGAYDMFIDLQTETNGIITATK
jgi:hypothetical protein